MLMYVLLLVGFVLLIKGADFFVDGSSSVAKILKIPSVIIGLTIVAFGTSAPEAAVSISAAINGSNEIAVGNVIGSNIFNVLVVVGVCAVVSVVTTNKDISNRDFPLCIIGTIVLIGMLADGMLSRIEGILLLVAIILYVSMLVITALKNRENGEDYEEMTLPKSILYIIGGIVAVIYGGQLVVDNACAIARAWNVSETVIALTIVALGTSLPELVTSVIATKKGEYGLALGNVVGSNIFNIAFILGLSASIYPIKMSGNITEVIIDAVCALSASVLMFIFCKTGKKINKAEGAICLLLYVAYVAYLFIR